MWTGLRQDVGYAVRLLGRSPAFTLIAVLTLGLGIGATTAIFSLANWTLLRPVAGVRAPQEVRIVWTGGWAAGGGFSPSRVSYPNYFDVAARLKTVSGIAARQSGGVSLAGPRQEARPASANYVTASFFDLLGIRMRLGRPFTAAEDNPSSPTLVAVISDHLWASMFGRDPNVFAEPLTVNGKTLTIVGVAAEGFQGVDRVARVDLWIAGSAYPTLNHFIGMRYDDRAIGGYYELLVRRAPEASWPQVEAELTSLSAWLAAEHPKENAKFSKTGFYLLGAIGADPLGRNRLASLFAVMMGVSGLVLLIACANVASLLLIRGVRRAGEVAIRKSMGASQLRLLRQHVTEGALLWLLGGAAGIGLVWILTRVIEGPALVGVRASAARVPIDWRVIAFAAALSLVVGILFSVLPALRAMRTEAAVVLRTTGPAVTRRGFATGTALTVIQLGASLTLLVGALLLNGTARHLAAVELGFEPDGVYLFRVNPQSLGYRPERGLAYVHDLAARLRTHPAVARVAMATELPFFDARSSTRIRRLGASDPAATERPLSTSVISPDLFPLLGIRLIHGRLFSDDDIAGPGRTGRRLVILSESLARRLFDRVEIQGEIVEFPVLGREGKTWEVVGVVSDIQFHDLSDPMEPMVYETFVDRPMRSASFALRAARPFEAGAEARRIAADLDRALPVGDVQPLPAVIGQARAEWDLLARLLSSLAGVAGLLSAVGLYGVIAFGVTARRREFGIRIALGAEPRRVLRLVLRRTAALTAAGLVAGFAGAVFLTRVLASRLVGVQPFDPALWTLAATGLIAIAVIASALPARAATQVDVTETLRSL